MINHQDVVNPFLIQLPDKGAADKAGPAGNYKHDTFSLMLGIKGRRRPFQSPDE